MSLPKPYYQDAAVTIYHADCRDILPLLEPGSIDLVLTDPPYGVNFEGKATKHTTIKPGGYTTEDNAELGPEVISELLRTIHRLIVFPGVVNLHDYPKSQDIGCVYCPSGAGIGRWGFTCFHPILFYGPRPRNSLAPTSMMSFATSEDNGHPCPKPIEWMRWLITLGSEKGNTILDPFMGSGTTLRAAKDLGRKAIGVEIEERYCEVAAKRMAQMVMQL